jgi:hypothetical protein
MASGSGHIQLASLPVVVQICRSPSAPFLRLRINQLGYDKLHETVLCVILSREEVDQVKDIMVKNIGKD